MHYLLFYEVADDYLARRAEFREAHLQKAWAASDRGELLPSTIPTMQLCCFSRANQPKSPKRLRALILM